MKHTVFKLSVIGHVLFFVSLFLKVFKPSTLNLQFFHIIQSEVCVPKYTTVDRDTET